MQQSTSSHIVFKKSCYNRFRDLLLNDIKREQTFDPTGGRRVQSAGQYVYTSIDWVCIVLTYVVFNVLETAAF